jgi:hypothetical protein
MVVSRPEWLGRWPVAAHAGLLGVALGTLAMAGGGVFLRDAEGLLAASAGVIVTVVAALATGMWAGAPDVSADEPRLRTRWFAAGLLTGVAGIHATIGNVFPAVHQGIALQTLGLLVMVAAPVYALGLVVPALTAWADRWEESRADGGDPAEGGPLGTLVVALLAGLAVGVAVAGAALVPYLGAGPVLFATGAALLLPTVLPDPMPPEAEEKVIYDAHTPVGGIRVVEIVYPGQRQPERRLYVNGEEESGELVRSGAPTLPYIAAAEQWLAETARRGDSYLFLGGGAYTLPRRIAEHDPRAGITVVELDPEITRVAYRYFGMRRGYGIRSVHGDARAFLEQAEAAAFDRIYVDVYGGHEALPYSLVTREAFGLLARALRPRGMLTINVIGETAGDEAPRLWSIVRTVGAVFPSLTLYTHLGPDYPERQNLLLAASAEAGYGFPPRAGLFEPWPAAEWPEFPGAVVFRDLLPPDPYREDHAPVRRAAGE